MKTTHEAATEILADQSVRLRKILFLAMSTGNLRLECNEVYIFNSVTGTIKKMDNEYEIQDFDFCFKTPPTSLFKQNSIDKMIALALLKYGYAMRKIDEPERFIKYVKSLNN